MKDVPRSEQFNDIYFSPKDGLAETAHVFLKGNDLPQAWAGKNSFTIVETGFGTGLNFFSAWKLFEETAEVGQRLDFISVEKYPLNPDEIRAALSHWADNFEGRIDSLLAQYPLRIAGFHRIQLSSSVTLTLIFDDVNAALPQLSAAVDCWFLDGFTPAKNPDMWTNTLYVEMARLSVNGASYATFTAASDVRRGLEVASFSVNKHKGFDYKREMIAGRFVKNKMSSFGLTEGSKVPKRDASIKPKDDNTAKIAIIGGGLAGTSCAYVLKQYGFNPEIYEQSDSLASGASGNKIGLYNPRFSKRRDSLSDFFAPAYAQIIRVAKQASEAADYTLCGALHLMNDDKKIERYTAMAQNWQWHEDHVQVLDTKQASDVAGIELDCGALYLPDSGHLSPQKLCAYYARDIKVNYNSNIKSLKDVDADIIILACGAAVQNFAELSWLELENVRGQVTVFEETENTKKLKCNILHGGYLSCTKNGLHVAGSTFEKWVEHTQVTDKNHHANIQKLKENIDVFEDETLIIKDGRAGMRAATNDRFPVVGAVPNHENLYVSAAFGSHGIVSSIMGAHIIADMIRGGALSLPIDTVYQLSPRRFIDRAAKKGRVLA